MATSRSMVNSLQHDAHYVARPIFCFIALKHRWNGKQRRLLELFRDGTIITRVPETLQVTNRWHLAGCGCDNISSGSSQTGSHDPDSSLGSADFYLLVSGDSKRVIFTATSEHQRMTMLERMNEILFGISKSLKYVKHFNVTKIDLSHMSKPAQILICNHALIEIEICGDNKNLHTIYMSEIISCSLNESRSKAIVHLKSNMLTVYETVDAENMLNTIKNVKLQNYLSFFRINPKPFAENELLTKRLGKFNDDQSLISLSETNCTIYNGNKSSDNESRVLVCITCACIIERDVSTYNISSIYDLADVCNIVRDTKNLQLFTVELKYSKNLQYLCVHRDIFISSIIDGARGVGNMQCTMSSISFSGYRFGIYQYAIDSESEINQIKLLANLKQNSEEEMENILIRFVANIPYDGSIDDSDTSFFQTSKSKLIMAAINNLIARSKSIPKSNSFLFELYFMALKRLLSTKRGYKFFSNSVNLANVTPFIDFILLGTVYNDDFINYIALDCLCALVQPNTLEIDLATEQTNKLLLFQSPSWLSAFSEAITNSLGTISNSLKITALTEILIYILARPYSDTTPNDIFDTILMILVNKGRSLFKLFSYQSLAINKNASLIFRAIIEESTLELAQKMQELSIYEGILLKHLYSSIFKQHHDNRVKLNQQVSRELLTLWVSENLKAQEVISNIFPKGLLKFLKSTEKPPELSKMAERNTALNYVSASSTTTAVVSDTFSVLENKVSAYFRRHWQLDIREKLSIESNGSPKKDRNTVVLRKQKRTIKHSKQNWDLFFYNIHKDHFLPDLIWNATTRSELSEILENQLKQLNMDRQLNPDISLSWNYKEFSVYYSSLDSEILVGDYYLRPLVKFSDGITKIEDPSQSNISNFIIDDPNVLFSELNHKYMIEKLVDRRVELLKAMSYIYSLNIADVAFYRSIMYIVNLLDTSHLKERDSIILLLKHLVKNEKNSKEIILNGGLITLCELLPLCHLEVDKALLPFEAGLLTLMDTAPSNDKSTEINNSNKIWYYSVSQNVRKGPVTFKELTTLFRSKEIESNCKVWTPGFTEWAILEDLAQFRWGVINPSSGLKTKLQITQIILEILIQMNYFYPTKDEDGCLLRPMPKIKSFFSNNRILSILVNLYLTNDPSIIDKTTQLLLDMCQDNILLSQIYRTGVYFFMLMYPGSNISTIAQFLKKTHMMQSFYSTSHLPGNVYRRSILKNILPEALIFYLQTHKYEKFVNVFLSEVKSPEVIWNSQMRTHMIRCISNHVNDFTPLLKENILANYEFAQIPIIQYANLNKELFCHGFYLKYLCEGKVEPDFKFPDPVKFLKTLLVQWDEELKKEPNSYSIKEACRDLDVEPNADGSIPDMNVLKNAYRKAMRNFHPDNRKTGNTDKFIAAQNAYEFICSKEYDTGPNADHLHYFIRSQIILLDIHSEELKEFKYPGYEAIFSSITRDFKEFFSKSLLSMLLVDSVRLIEATIICSNLNALELVRVGGLKILGDIFNRSVNQLKSIRFDMNSLSFKNELEMCISILNCFSAGGNHAEFIEKVQSELQILENIFFLLFFTDTVDLSLATIDCIASISKHSNIQSFFIQHGAYFILIKNFFNFDYTLEDQDMTLKNSEETPSKISSAQVQINKLALSSASALKSLAKSDKNSNNSLQSNFTQLLDKFLTCFITSFLYNAQYAHALKAFTTTTCNPNTIWNNSTRQQLSKLVEEQCASIERTGGTINSSLLSTFEFTEHEKELIVSGIFVNLYNKDPSFTITDPENLMSGLVLYLLTEAKNYNRPSSPPPAVPHNYNSNSNQQSTDLILFDDYSASRNKVPIIVQSSAIDDDSINSQLIDIISVCTAIQNLVKAYPKTSSFLNSNIDNFFKLLEIYQLTKVASIITVIIQSSLESNEALNKLASHSVLGYLIVYLVSTFKAKQADSAKEALILVQRVASTSKLLGELFSKGLFIHLLAEFTRCDADYHIRTKILEVFSISMKDKLVGPKVALFLPRFIPKNFIYAIEDAFDACIALYEKDHDTPEMIWNSSLRKNVHETINQIHEELFNNQKLNKNYTFNLPAEYQIVFDEDPSAIIISGINLNRYLMNPEYVLRKPDEFMISFVHRWDSEMKKLVNEFCTPKPHQLIEDDSELTNSPSMQTMHILAQCSSSFFRTHKDTLALMQQTGTLHRFIEYMSMCMNKYVLLDFVIQMIENITISEDCSKHLVSLGIVTLISRVLEKYSKSVKIIGNILKNLSDHDISEFAIQMNNSDLIKKLMDVIASTNVQSDNPAEIKAIMVGMLKKIAQNSTCGSELNAKYDTYPIWNQFKFQDHSLYLAKTELDQPLALTGGHQQPKIAGYLLNNVKDDFNTGQDALPPALK